MKQKIILYSNPRSGHAHRVRLFLSLLGLPYELREMDLNNGEHKTHQFLKLNPFGQIPVIDDHGFILSDSVAILRYLANQYGDDHAWLGEDYHHQALIDRWLSIASNEMANGPAMARAILLFGRKGNYDKAKIISLELLSIMEQALDGKDYLVKNQLSLADIASYSYIAHVGEGGISLAAYPNILAWLKRIEKLEAFIPLQSPEQEIKTRFG